MEDASLPLSLCHTYQADWAFYSHILCALSYTPELYTFNLNSLQRPSLSQYYVCKGHFYLDSTIPQARN